MKKSFFAITLLAAVFASRTLPAADMEITPFRAINQSPLVMIQPLPLESSATIAPKGGVHTSLTFDLASSYTLASSLRESLLLDGESARWTVAARYGFSDRLEAGVEIPVINYGGGFLDSFIIGWHNFFGMPQGGRDDAEKNKINDSYFKDGERKLQMNSSSTGIGDITLTGGVKLLDDKTDKFHDAVAIRATMKLPTGESTKLRGSGALGGSLSLCGSSNHFADWGTVALYGSAGALVSAKGDVLRDQQKQVAGFGSVGLGLATAPWISFKMQANAHTPLYKDSDLKEVGDPAVMLVIGGALKFYKEYQLDIGVSEDISVGTAPDVGFHLSLSRIF